MGDTIHIDASYAVETLERALDRFTENAAIAIDNARADARREEPTLRDRFAMAALQGISDGFSDIDISKNQVTRLANRAYAIADAMLVARGPKRIADSEFEEVSP